MHNDNSDDPYGFWKDEPTRQLKRTQVGTRAHAETRMVPVVRMDRTRQIPELRPRNPLVTRIAVMGGVTLLLIPLALSMRNDQPQVRASEIQGVDTIQVGRLPLPAPTQATVAPATDAPTTTVADTTTVPPTPAPTEAAVVTPAPTEPPTTAAKKKVVPKSTTTVKPVAPAAAATQSADKAACALTYTVVKNDAWSTIASRAKVSMKSLLAANGATVNTLLLPGKSICLPTGAVAPGPPATNAPVAKAPSTTAPATTQPKPTPTQPTTPPATTAPPTTQPPPPPNTYTKAQVAQIIRDVWPDDLEDEAIRIATRESNLIPTVRNSCCYGLFQIYYAAHRTWLAGMGITSAAQLYDPRVNATAALALYNTSGWSPWATTTPTTSVA
jgi:LysM repeat protein